MTEVKTDTPIQEKSKYAIRIGKVLSKSSGKEGFSLSLVYTPEKEEEKVYGSLYFVIDIHSPSSLAPDIGYNLIDIVKEEFYRDLSKTPSQSFESALKAANEEFSAIAKEGEKSWLGKTNIVISVIAKNKLLAVARGTSEMHLWRNGKIMNLSEGMYTPGETYRPEETLTNIIEGDLSVGDKLVFSTAELFYYLSVEKLKRLVEANSPAGAAKEIAAQLKNESDIYRTNVIIAEFSLPELIDTDEEVAPEDNWITQAGEDIPAEIEKTTKPIFGGFSVRKETTAIADNNLLVDTPPKEVKPSKQQTATDMAQELDMREEDETATESSPTKMLDKLKMPKINYAQGLSNVSIAAGKLKTLATSPMAKKTGNIIFRYLKYAGLIILAVLDLIVNLVTDWVNDIKKRPDGSRILMTTIGVLAIVVVGSTLLLARNQTTRVSKKVAIESLESAIQKRDAAKAAIIYEDTAKASSLLFEAFGLAEAASNNEITKEDAIVVLAEVKSQLDEVGRTQRFDNPRLLTDFSTLASQINTSSRTETKININTIMAAGNDIYTYDLEHNKVFKYNDSRREAGIVNSLISKEKKIKLGSLNNNELIFYTNPAGIYSLDLNENIMENISLDTGNWNNANSLISYTDKLYFLDAENNNIWKYKAVSEGYTKIAPYFEDTENLDLSGATDFAIDGDIYILINGLVNKYTIGQQVEFNMRNIPEHTGEMGYIKDMDTDALAEGLYVLDADNNRIVSFDKETGEYLEQFIFSGIDNPSKIFVDEKSNHIWILSETQVYLLEI